MTINRVARHPSPGNLDSIEKVGDYLKTLHKSLQSEESTRLIDFDILTLNNVPYVDVRTYGARGDGVTDDTAAIQAAVDSLTGGGIVKLPPNSTCKIASSLILDDYVILEGSGSGSVVHYTGTGNAIDADSGYMYGARVRNLQLLGDNQGTGIKLSGWAWGGVYDCDIYGFTTGIDISSATRGGYHLFMRGNRINACTYGIKALGTGGYANRISITDNVIWYANKAIYAAGHLQWTIIGNGLEETSGVTPILLDWDGASAFIAGNYFESNSGVTTVGAKIRGSKNYIGHNFYAGVNLDTIVDYDATEDNFIDEWDTQTWTAPTLAGSWVNYSGDYNPAGYFKDGARIVHLRGMVAGGAVPGTIFTLPAGYRPAYEEVFAVASNGAFGQVTVYTDGYVYVGIGNNTYVSLDGISFRAA